ALPGDFAEKYLKYFSQSRASLGLRVMFSTNLRRPAVPTRRSGLPAADSGAAAMTGISGLVRRVQGELLPLNSKWLASGPATNIKTVHSTRKKHCTVI
uniref:40S ribosomal protein S15 n=1 Tax=Macrostomum lignano TaxID=282301 RepID=A0A1I8HB86_9PLAT